MNNLMAALGVDLYYKNIALNICLQTNSWEEITDHLEIAGKIHLGLTYNINQLYYLL